MSFDPTSVSRRDALRITAAVGIAAVAGGHTAMEIIRRAGLHRVCQKPDSARWSRSTSCTRIEMERTR